jgi:hypothetical protein
MAHIRRCEALNVNYLNVRCHVYDSLCSMHKNRDVKTRQLDDGIGDTLVLALEVPGNGRWGTD